MDDLVKRLQARADEQERSNSYPVDRAMDREAAAEITRLRAEVKAARKAALEEALNACWCPLDQPCHADVLLEIANK